MGLPAASKGDDPPPTVAELDDPPPAAVRDVDDAPLGVVMDTNTPSVVPTEDDTLLVADGVSPDAKDDVCVLRIGHGKYVLATVTKECNFSLAAVEENEVQIGGATDCDILLLTIADETDESTVFAKELVDPTTVVKEHGTLTDVEAEHPNLSLPPYQPTSDFGIGLSCRD